MSPLRLAYPGGTVEIVVHFAGKLNPQGTPEGNVTRVELWVNGVLVDTIQNPPNVKSGTLTFHLELSRYGEGTVILSAVAYQGNGKSAPSGTSASKAVGVDLTDPTGTITIPTEGALLPSARPMARADYTDPPGAGGYHSGIDRSAVRLYNEHGEDVTGDAEVGDAFLLYTPAPERALADGPHELRLHVVDLAGRTFETTRHFTTDTIPPGLTLETPGDGVSLFAADLAFALSATDANGVALVSATVDETPIADRFAHDGDRFTYTPHAGDTVVAELGLHTWHVVLADGAGNPAEFSSTYRIVESPGGGGTPTLPDYRLEIVGGNEQTGAIGRCVDGPQDPGTPTTAPGLPLKVHVTDANAAGADVAGVPLVFDGPGFVVEAPGFSTVTDSHGIAAVRYILSRTPGDDHVKATVLGGPPDKFVEFIEHAVMPTLATTLDLPTTPGFAGGNLLAKGGAGWVYASLTRPGAPGDFPIGVSASMRLDITDDSDRPAVEADMYVNPRSRMTTEYGAASFIAIPEDVVRDRSWFARLKIPDFPELELPRVAFTSSPTLTFDGEVVQMPEMFALQGEITAVSHPVTLRADLTPMITKLPRIADLLTPASGFVVTGYSLAVFARVEDERRTRLYTLSNADEDTGTIVEGVWSNTHLDPHFVLKIAPTAGSVGSYPWLLTAEMKVHLVRMGTGERVEGLYHERLVVGAPEVEMVQRVGSEYPALSHVPILPPEERTSSDPYQFFIELRTSLAEASAPTLTLESRGVCDDALTRVETPAGKSAPTMQDVSLSSVSSLDTNRYRLRRVPIVLTDRILANVPTPTSAGMTVLHFGDPRSLLLAEILGSSSGVGTGGLTVSGLPSYSIVNGKRNTIEARFNRPIGTEIPTLSGTRTFPDGSTEEIGIPGEPERIGAVARWTADLPQGQIRLRTEIAGEAIEANVLIVPTATSLPLSPTLGLLEDLPVGSNPSREPEFARMIGSQRANLFEEVSPRSFRSTTHVGIALKLNGVSTGASRITRFWPALPTAALLPQGLVQVCPLAGEVIDSNLLNALGLHPDAAASYRSDFEAIANEEGNDPGPLYRPYFTPEVEARIGTGDPSDQPFTGSGATGRYLLATAGSESARILLDIKLHVAKYVNPVSGNPGLAPGRFPIPDDYLATLSSADRIAQARTLANHALIEELSPADRSPYRDTLIGMRRAAFIDRLATIYKLDRAVLIGYILAEQRDQSENEDIKDLLVNWNLELAKSVEGRVDIVDATTSIGLGQIRPATALQYDLFADVAGPGFVTRMSMFQIGRALAWDDFNLLATAKYLRIIADLGPGVRTSYPELDLSTLREPSSAWGTESGLSPEQFMRAWTPFSTIPEAERTAANLADFRTLLLQAHPGTFPLPMEKQTLILFLGSEGNSTVWDRSGPNSPRLGIGGFWGHFSQQAYDDAKAAGF